MRNQGKKFAPHLSYVLLCLVDARLARRGVTRKLRRNSCNLGSTTFVRSTWPARFDGVSVRVRGGWWSRGSQRGTLWDAVYLVPQDRREQCSWWWSWSREGLGGGTSGARGGGVGPCKGLGGGGRVRPSCVRIGVIESVAVE